MTKEEIVLRKYLQRFRSQAERNAKPTRCYLCNKETSALCTSHSVPRMALKRIAQNGHLLSPYRIMGNLLTDEEVGIASAGVFRYICKECDSRCFQDYENDKLFDCQLSDREMSEIAVKNCLQMLYKRGCEKALYTLLDQNNPGFLDIDNWMRIISLDERDFEEELLMSQRQMSVTSKYRILYYRVLPYVTPIAAQGLIPLYKDCRGRIINDKYGRNDEERLQCLHLLIFPSKRGTLVAAFYHVGNRKYKNLRHDFNSMAEDDVLQYLTYQIFATMENYFISPGIKDIIENSKPLQQLAGEEDGLPLMSRYLGVFPKGYRPTRVEDIPNLLSDEYALERISIHEAIT